MRLIIGQENVIKKREKPDGNVNWCNKSGKINFDNKKIEKNYKL